MNIVSSLPPKPEPAEFVALDVEMFGMTTKLLHRPTTGNFACLTICLERDPETVYIVTDEKKIGRALSLVYDGVWVFHHAKFDITQLRRYHTITPRSKIWDTMLIDQIQYSGYFDGFALDDLVRRRLNIKLDKSLQKSFEKATELSQTQIEYACNDTKHTMLVALDQRKQICKTDFSIWKKIELPFMWALLDFRGFRIDVDKWNVLADENEAAMKALKESAEFNPGSWQQVLKLLRQTGFKKLPNTEAETLEVWIQKYPDADAVPYAKLVLAFKSYSKNATTYGKNITRNFIELESPGVWVVFGDYKQIGAETSRTACSNPNFQNIPIKQGPQYRECFIARPNNKLIVLDFSQQEPNISAFLSQDANLLKANKSGDDIYIETANIFYADKITKHDPRRKEMKAIFLGLDYGMTAKGLAIRLGISEDDAEKLQSRFFNTFPGMRNWSTEQRKKKTYVTTMTGRKLWLNPYSGQRERNALNAPHQGGGSEMMKLTTIKFHQGWKSEWGVFGQVAEVHDELILDVPEEHVNEIAKFAEDCACAAGEELCPGVIFRVGIEIGDNWSVKE